MARRIGTAVVIALAVIGVMALLIVLLLQDNGSVEPTNRTSGQGTAVKHP